jgi:hypothetical protein
MPRIRRKLWKIGLTQGRQQFLDEGENSIKTYIFSIQGFMTKVVCYVINVPTSWRKARILAHTYLEMNPAGRLRL